MQPRMVTALLAAGGVLAAAGPASAQDSFAPDVSCRWGAADCNRAVPGLGAQFRALRDHGDLLGFRMGPAPDVSVTKHWQGVARLTAGGGRFLAVSRSGRKVSFVVVRLGSRGSSGERYRSNRIGGRSGRVRPPSGDRVVAVVGSDPGFNHSGGMQVAGNVLAVGLEEGGRSRVVFWDVSAPASPRRLGTFFNIIGRGAAGTVSLARLRDGRHLLIVGGSGANTLFFHVSRAGTALADAQFDHTATWNEDELVGGDSEFGDYQSLNLVAGTDGRLYLIGTHRNGALTTGRDFADLFRLEGDPRSPRIRKIAARHLFCAVPRDGQQCNLDAAGGAYVTPAGGLLLYGTEHDNDGPGGSVKAEEFRVAPHRSSCTGVADAWVELYDDVGFDGDRSVMIDYRDRNRRNYENYDQVEGFEDKASAARWCLPEGARYRLFKHKRGCRGRTVDLPGTGRPARDRKFGDGSGAVRSFNDEVSCSRWIVPPPPPTPTPTPTPAPVPTPTSTPLPTPTPTPTPSGRPDLIISDFQPGQFTVRNQGVAAAGPFFVTVSGVPDFQFSGLAAGGTATRAYALPCEAPREATADSRFQVDESSETNNVATFSVICRRGGA